MNPKTRTCAAIAALLGAAGAAQATNGYFPHGYGMKSLGMGGAATALAQDSMGGANNPASMVWAGSRLDLGVNWFRPERYAERSGALIPPLNGRIDSGRENFLVPEFGYNRLINPDLSLGVTVYGNGGMNTSYGQGNFACPTPMGTMMAANILCGGGGTGVDLMQLVVAPTVAYKVATQHSVGASLLLGYQRFKAQGLQGFAAMSSFPASVAQNNGADSATGAGLRVGYQGRLSDSVSIGAAYASKIDMGRFDKYQGLFAGAGDFDVPSNWSLGIAFRPHPDWTVALDYGRINYSDVAAVGNASMSQAPLGAATGPGFGWTDINVFKLGVAWQMSPTLTLRAGYNRGGNPVRGSDVTFNILAPGVMTRHFTLGFTLATDKDSELTGALMVAPRNTVSGASMFNGMMAGMAGQETVGMRQTSFGLAWSRRF